MRYQTVLLFGAPGSGKGTQGKIIGSVPGYFHFACGDAFRNLRIYDPLGKIFIEHSAKGQLVPDEPTIELWRRNIESSTLNHAFDPKNDTLVLDGIPRNVNQARILEDMLDVRAVVHLHCADKAKMVNRLQKRALRDNRLDDANLEVIQQRLEAYEQETRPVLDYYGPGRVHTINATQSPGEVLRETLDILLAIKREG